MTGDPEYTKVKLLREQNEILKEEIALLHEQNNLLKNLCEDAIGWLKQIDRDIRDK